MCPTQAFCGQSGSKCVTHTLPVCAQVLLLSWDSRKQAVRQAQLDDASRAVPGGCCLQEHSVTCQGLLEAPAGPASKERAVSSAGGQQ